jgi:hypothetical protein
MGIGNYDRIKKNVKDDMSQAKQSISEYQDISDRGSEKKHTRIFYLVPWVAGILPADVPVSWYAFSFVWNIGIC